ncbi:GAF domain-containing sensor histidine kinase [Priestia megaterium]|nr:GAF domain-containing sensor histidine kinase [Priestia megaterium]
MEKQPISELKILKDIAEILNEGTDLHDMLHDALTKLLEVTDLHTGWIFFIDTNGKHEMVAAQQLPPALLNEGAQPMCNGTCWCIDRYMDGRLQKASNIMECKRLEDSITYQWGDTCGITHHATVPLQAGDERFGLLNVAAPRKAHFKRAELDMLGSVALQIGTAIKRVKLTEKEQELKLIEERNRLAKDLHDSVNQLLFSINITAKAGSSLAKEQQLKDTFSLIQETAQHAQVEMKALIWQLRPQGLENGIVSALKSYGQMLGLEVTEEIKGVSVLPAVVEETLWRVGQEAFNNCRKHADTKNVSLSVVVKKDRVVMKIRDAGSGFIYKPSVNLPTLGLKTMNERVKRLFGTFNVESSIGNGTTITVTIPL